MLPLRGGPTPGPLDPDLYFQSIKCPQLDDIALTVKVYATLKSQNPSTILQINLILSPWMKLLMQFLEMLAGDVGVYLSG